MSFLISSRENMICKYLSLMETRSDLFPMKDRIVTDEKTLLSFSNDNDKDIGVVYESPWHYLIVDVVADENGNPKFAYERYLSCSTQPGGVAVPIMPDGRICLLENYRHMLGRTVLELPRGMGADGESGAQAAVRELFEELGAEAKTINVLGKVVADSGINGDMVSIVRIDVEHTDVRIGHEGIQGCVFMTMDEIDEAISTGKINDGFTLSAIAMLKTDIS